MLQLKLVKYLPDSATPRDEVVEVEEKQVGKKIITKAKKAVVYVEAVIRVQQEYELEAIPEQTDAESMGGVCRDRPSDAQPQRRAAVSAIRAKLAELFG